VVITGAGIITALGAGWKPNAEGFRRGRVAFRPVSSFDVSRQRVKTAGELDLPATLPATQLSGRQIARLDRSSILLLTAACEAWEQSGWEPNDQTPLVLGTTSGGMTLGEDYFRHATQEPLRHRGQPTRAFCYQAQTQARIVLDALGIAGPVTLMSNACSTGTSAIGHAWELIRTGQAERAFAGGYDALCQLVFAGFDALQALSPTTCRPFDAHRDGLGLGEGAAMLTLETLESARQRDAVILGEVVGFGTTLDAHHLTQPHPAGDAAFIAMNQACASARLLPAQIDYVNAHGTGTPLNDSSEASAIHRWAGDRVATLAVSSTKANVGHLLGAAGAVEAIVCLMALREQWLPPETTLETPDPICRFRLVSKPEDARVNYTLSNSFGFGGVNATLLLRRWS
jgi:3-oxoacyl-[acyl-carrier-protein] synthase II